MNYNYKKLVFVCLKAYFVQVVCDGPLDYMFDAEMAKYKGVESPVEWMDAEDPLFILYTRFDTFLCVE